MWYSIFILLPSEGVAVVDALKALPVGLRALIPLMLEDLLKAEPGASEEYMLYQFKDVIPRSNGMAGTEEVLAEFNRVLSQNYLNKMSVILADRAYFASVANSGMTLALVQDGVEYTDSSAVLFGFGGADNGFYVAERASEAQIAKTQAFQVESDRRRSNYVNAKQLEEELVLVVREYVYRQLQAADLSDTQKSDVDYALRNSGGTSTLERLVNTKLDGLLEVLAILGHKDLPRF
jgi:hypothetical protein